MFDSHFWLLVSLAVAFAQHKGKAQQQYFRVKPSDKDIIEGQTAELQCHIGNLGGDVQWTKDGFLLGFNPAIPGYPRYSMVVDEERGVYNLRIRNTNMDDEAEYQCQVGPALNNHPIRAAAKIHVLVPPKRVDIEGRTNGSTVDTREAERVTLTCSARGSKPSTTLKWFKNGKEIKSDTPQTTVETINDNLHNSMSTITIYPKMDDNGAIYTCEAVHVALQRPLKAVVTISVLFPPGPPEIEGYQDGDIVQVGDKLTLACISRGGNPPARLVWYRNDVQVDVTYTTSGREATNTHTFTVNTADNNVVYRCEASNSVTHHPLIASVKLTVFFSPSRVTINGPKEGKVGDSVSLTCITGSSNPPVDISWIVDGRPIMSAHSVTTDESGGWTTTSIINVTLTRQDPDTKTFSCYAVSEALGDTVVQTATLTIVYPPNPPKIIKDDEDKPLKAGDLYRLNCLVLGGNPFATVRWFKGDKEIRAISTNTGTGVSSELMIRAESSDNGAIYRCEASNPATIRPLSASITTDVLFPPTSVNIKIKPRKPKSGEMVTMVCESGSSNPEAIIQWWKDGDPIVGQHDGAVDSIYGGKSTRSRIRFNVTSSDDGSIVTCQATNTVVQKSINDVNILRVMYKPEFLNSPSEKFDVVEGESTVINITAKGNPPIITYSWTKDGVPLLDVTENYATGLSAYTGHRIVFRGALLEIEQATREDSGEYDCEASNSEGVGKTSIFLNVLYQASVIKVTKMAIADAGDKAYFECVATANPLSNDVIKWRRKGFDMSRTQEVVERDRSYLTVLNVSKEDIGIFECVAYNGIGDESIGRAQLIVKFKPKIHLPKNLLNVAGDIGETARLVCLADGAPDVSFVWSYNGEIIGDNFSNDKYASQSTQLNEIKWESILFVRNLKISDFGQYSCVARNELGHDHLKLKLRKRGRPDPPESLRVVNITHDSVILTWIPGFSSGLPQHFRIKYKKSGTEEFAVADVVPSNSTIYGIKNLEPGSEYVFAVVARNALGESEVLEKETITFTLTEGHNFRESASASLDAFSGEEGEVPRLLLVIVSLVGSILLVLNVILVICFIQRRKRRQQRANAVNESEKSETTLTPSDSLMYTPSKYQQTINGEALCPLDELEDNCPEELMMKEIVEDSDGTINSNHKLITVNELDWNDKHENEKKYCRDEENCPDILRNRIDDSKEYCNNQIAQVSPEMRYVKCPIPLPGTITKSRGRVSIQDSINSKTANSGKPVSCVMGKVGSHMV